MEGQVNKWSWCLISDSVIGSIHKDNNKPNQDAIASFSPEWNESFIIALSDGHGGKMYFRSDIGARFAVKAAQEVMQEFQQKSLSAFSPSVIKQNKIVESIPYHIVNGWNEKVKEHLEQNPLNEAELNVLGNNDQSVAYGATLLIAMVTETCIVYLQIGDGEIFVVSIDGKIERPVPEHKQSVITETKSLCLDASWDYFRVQFRYLPYKEQWPVLILLSTDGYVNSFKTTQGFLQVGPDILGMLRTYGREAVQANLKKWLTEGMKFNGDDATLAILCRTDILNEKVSVTDMTDSGEKEHHGLDNPQELNLSPIEEDDGSFVESESAPIEEQVLEQTEDTMPSTSATANGNESEEEEQSSSNDLEILNLSPTEEDDRPSVESENTPIEEQSLETESSISSQTPLANDHTRLSWFAQRLKSVIAIFSKGRLIVQKNPSVGNSDKA